LLEEMERIKHEALWKTWMEDSEKRWHKEAKYDVFYYFDFNPEEHIGLFTNQDLTMIDEVKALSLGSSHELQQKREALYVHYHNVAKAQMELADQAPIFTVDGDESH
jgi:hypothetical protein